MTPEQAAHSATPRPWPDPVNFAGSTWQLVGRDEQTIALVSGEADARLIVLAVNAYEEGEASGDL